MKRILTLIIVLVLTLAACSNTTLVPTVAPIIASATNTSLPPTSTSVPEVTAATTNTPLPPTSASEPGVTATDPASVFMAYYGNLIAKNLDAAMALVADEGISFCYSDPCITNKEKVRTFWQSEFDNGWVPYISILKVDGDTVTYAFTAVQRGRVDVWGTGKVVVESGKVKSDH